MTSREPCNGSLLIGSCPWNTTEDALRQFSEGLPGRIKRIPDGETGKRNYFVLFQWLHLQELVPNIASQWEDNKPVKPREFTAEQIEQGLAEIRAKGFETGYDTAAFESYAEFKKLKNQGVIPEAVKFQVCLPTIASVVSLFVERQFQPGMAVIYEEALFKAVRKIQDEIPNEELAIQIDLAADNALWEGVLVEWWGEGETKEAVVDYTARMIAQIDEGVELGMHNCYGDMEHKHWMEPTSLAAISERMQGLYDKKIRPLQWFHVPVPLSAMDKLDSYFEPLLPLLPQFQKDKTEIYLGLVHPNDLEGTWQRIEAARKVLGKDVAFGVATECGLGRTPVDDISSIMEVSRAVSKPVLEGFEGLAKPIAA